MENKSQSFYRNNPLVFSVFAFALSGLVSGALVNETFVFKMGGYNYTVIPGLVFGVALCYASHLYKKINIKKAILITGFSGLGYLSAFEICAYVSAVGFFNGDNKTLYHMAKYLNQSQPATYFISGFTGTFILSLVLPKTLKLPAHFYISLPLCGGFISLIFIFEKILNLSVSFFIWQWVAGIFISLILYLSSKKEDVPGLQDTTI